MRLIWTRHAKENVKEIVRYIGTDDPAAARRVGDRITKRAAILARKPFMGRTGAVSGTRETIPHPSFRIVYQVTGEAVIIMAVVHTSRQWPPEDV